MVNLQTLQPSDVLSAYSGKAGKCMCGCSGNHYANPSRLAEAEQDRGYPYSSGEVSGEMVTRILRLVQAHFDPKDRDACGEAASGVSFFSADVGRRTYVVYIKQARG